MPFTNPLVAGTTLIRDAIESPGYTPGVVGWAIRRDGTAEFSDVDIRGELTATGSDGSTVRIYNDGTGHAVVELTPPADGTHGSVTNPARFVAGSTGGLPGAFVEAPRYATGDSQPYLFLSGASADTRATLFADTITLSATEEAIIDAPLGTTVSGELTASSVDVVGNLTVGGQGPGRFITASTRSTPSAGFTAPTTIDTVTFSALPDTEYVAVWDGSIQSSVALDHAAIVVQSNGVTFIEKVISCNVAARGNVVQFSRAFTPNVGGSVPASVTVNVIAYRASGTGNISSHGGAVGTGTQTNTLEIYGA